MLLYHHSRTLESVVFGEVKANPAFSDSDFKDAYLWLEKEIGFYPLFLAVGITDEDLQMTGYQDQWRRLLGKKPDGKEYREKGEFPNYVLFSFKDIDGIFMDFVNWHLVLNSSYNNYNISDYEKRLIFKPSWQKSRWLRKARTDQGSIQLVVSRLYLPEAARIWVRNKKTKRLLESLGFHNAEAQKLSLL